MRPASATSPAIVASSSPTDTTTSQAGMPPTISRTGTTSGEDTGTNVSTCASVPSGSSTALKLRKNDASSASTTGVALDWTSSWRGTIAPTTPNAQEYSA